MKAVQLRFLGSTFLGSGKPKFSEVTRPAGMVVVDVFAKDRVWVPPAKHYDAIQTVPVERTDHARY